METLKVTVSRIRFPNEEKDRGKRADGEKYVFYVLECACENGLNVIAKGELLNRPELGERLKLEGNYIVWQGQRQFSFKTAEINLPVSERDMLRYACEMTNGIGPAMEEKIWEKRGDDWRDVCAEDGIKGLTDGKLAALQSTIRKIEFCQIQAQTIAWLRSLGCTMGLASAAWEKWTSQTQTKVNGNPYILCELPNYGFADADKLRERFGIGDTDERRLKAAVLYCMGLLTEGGCNVVPWFQLDAELQAKLPNVPPKVYSEQVAKMFGYELIGWPEYGMVAFAHDYEDEMDIYDFVCKKKLEVLK